MDAREILRVKRDGGELSEVQMRALLGGYLAGEVPETLVAAFTALVFARGMQPGELASWTRCMLASGAQLEWQLDGPVVDKHSTGGVGDKVSLPLAPALAACGAYVPMISGRGLGHTGGTLDKLEAIPGLRTNLELTDIRRIVGEVGAVIAGQTAELVPADRRLYALRDETGLVESIPLISSSILSKKLAEGLDALVLDVKFGSGAFLVDIEQGRELARTMLSIAHSCGLRASVLQTSMHAPLGRAVGHSLEVRESIECLRGGGPADLRGLVCALGGQLLDLVEADSGGAQRIAAALDDGSALERFERMVLAQGGDPASIRDPQRLPTAPHIEEWTSPEEGYLEVRDCRAFGHACTALGGGRVRADDVIDFGVGIEWLACDGQSVRAGEPLARLHYREEAQLEAARACLLAGLSWSEGAPTAKFAAGQVEAILASDELA